jgi:hypothetical protein
MIWVAGRSPTLVSYSLRGVAMNLKATTLTYLAIEPLERDVRPQTWFYVPHVFSLSCSDGAVGWGRIGISACLGCAVGQGRETHGSDMREWDTTSKTFRLSWQILG